jgi:ABC-2 type transport system ATP-binding protein
MDCVIDFQNAVFVADGFPVIAGVDMRVMGGEVIHLRGANGAGKTSLLRALVGLIQIKSGRAIVLGHDLADDRFSVRKDVGLLGHRTFLYDDLTASEFLRFVGGLVKLPKNQIEVVVEQRLTESHLQDEKNKLIKHFSLGMKKRISIAAGLMRNPKLLVLDEITNGLDPIASQEVKIQLR